MKTMGTKEIKVRVRPMRPCVVLGKDSSYEDIDLVFKFYSRLWGGRFGLILVNPSDDHEAIRGDLATARPDFVYGLNVDHDRLKAVCMECCQPRGYGELTEEFVERFYSRESAGAIQVSMRSIFAILLIVV